MNKLTIGIPYAWKRSNSTLHFLLKCYILSLLDALEEETYESKETIVDLFVLAGVLVSELRSVMEAMQAHMTLHKARLARWVEK